MKENENGKDNVPGYLPTALQAIFEYRVSAPNRNAQFLRCVCFQRLQLTFFISLTRRSYVSSHPDGATLSIPDSHENKLRAQIWLRRKHELPHDTHSHANQPWAICFSCCVSFSISPLNTLLRQSHCHQQTKTKSTSANENKSQNAKRNSHFCLAAINSFSIFSNWCKFFARSCCESRCFSV